MQEEWRKWPKDEKYQVSNLGQIKGKTGRILKQQIIDARGGYVYVNIDKPGTTNQRTRATVHRMVMETFNPVENSDNLVIDHINGIRTDNSLENLRWVTSAENTRLGRENRKEINDKISELIQKYGYEKTKELIFAIN